MSMDKYFGHTGKKEDQIFVCVLKGKKAAGIRHDGRTKKEESEMITTLGVQWRMLVVSTATENGQSRERV